LKETTSHASTLRHHCDQQKDGATREAAEGNVFPTAYHEVHATSISLAIIRTKHALRTAFEKAAYVQWLV